MRLRQGAFASAVLHLEESLTLYRAEASTAGTALGLLTLGCALRLLGDLSRSVTLLEESLATYQRLGDLRYIAITQTMLGSCVLQQGDVERAATLVLDGLIGHRAVADRSFAVYGLLDLAAVLTAQKRPVAAVRTCLGEAAYAVAWDAGRTLTLEQALAEASAPEEYAASMTDTQMFQQR